MEEDVSAMEDSNVDSNLSAIIPQPCDDSDAVSTFTPAFVRIFFGVIYVVGLAVNATLACTILAKKSTGTRSIVFIGRLATVNFLLIVVTVPLAMQRYITDTWKFGGSLCKVSEFLQTLSLAVSVLTLTALSGDRLVAIAFPLYGYKTGSLRRVVWIAASIWITSLLLSLPDLIGAQTVVGCMGQCLVCRPHPPGWTVNGSPYRVLRIFFRFVAFFTLPLLLIAVFYVAIAIKLCRQPRACSKTETIPIGKGSLIVGINASERHRDQRHKVANVVLLFVVIFVVCWLPVHVFTFIKTFGTPTDCFAIYWVVFDWISHCLVFVYAAANPFALYVINTDFRRQSNRHTYAANVLIGDEFG